MTDQLKALETLVGRALTAEETEAIKPMLAARNDEAIAGILSAGRVRTRTAHVGIGNCLAAMAPDGGLFLDTMERAGKEDPNIKWSLKMIEQGSFDIGHPVARAQLMEFADANPEIIDAARALLKVAEAPDPVRVSAVSDALNTADPSILTLGDLHGQ